MHLNLDLLKSAQSEFLNRYPGGFAHPEMQAISKKHQVEKRTTQVKEWFSYENFIEQNAETISNNIIKITTSSSLVLVFEKPRFRDAVRSMSPAQKQLLCDALQARLHGDAQEGFEQMTQLLAEHKTAKWPILTVIPNYLNPKQEAFVKPTTAKGIIQYFEVDNLKYSPKPTWQFYAGFRDLILELKSHSDSSLTDSNAAFCGFLMMTIEWNR